jgi:phosphohistidine phosphatase SixA
MRPMHTHGVNATATQHTANVVWFHLSSIICHLSSVMSSREKIQKVVFVRHGVALHNLLDPVTGQRPNLEDPALFDPPLVFHGKQQALEVGERLKMWRHSTQLGDEVELVITSPLTRCIQTTMLGFLPGDCYSTRGRHEPKIYCTELVREAFGMHYPDKRRDKSLLMVGDYID